MITQNIVFCKHIKNIYDSVKIRFFKFLSSFLLTLKSKNFYYKLLNDIYYLCKKLFIKYFQIILKLETLAFSNFVKSCGKNQKIIEKT